MNERAKVALRTSDVTRPRILGLAAIGGAVGALIAAVAEAKPLVTPRPIVRAHANVACASCHTEGSANPSVASCTSCHGTDHGSTRAGHRTLAAKGELTCATCHRQHAGGQGLTFEPSGIVRWGSGTSVTLDRSRAVTASRESVPALTTVPLVAVAACARCHDPSRASDPIAACVPGDIRARNVDVAQVASRCFDEHVRLDDLSSRRGSRDACARQHTADRFTAWEAAQALATSTPWVSAPKQVGRPWTPAVGALAGSLGFVVASAALERRKRRSPNDREPPAPARRKRLPMIDPSTCLGCYACVDACPFDVLAIEKYVAVVVRPDECCGVLSCEQVCPNGSLRVAEGDVVPDRPQTDEHLESRDVPGLFLAGDLTGLPLIKNAIHQGARVVDRIASAAPARRKDAVDVVIIGAGPAGLSAALRAKEKGLSAVVLEQASVAASIRSFPRDKIVHDPPLDLPVVGELWLKESTKEELLAQWSRIVRARKLDVREGHRVVDVARSEDGFVVVSEHGDTRAELRAARVVLAIGRRGTPRQLDLNVEPGAEDRIAYALADARSFAGKRVVVVGLGDTAMEAAIALARQPDTDVTISYRGAGFARGKKRNISEVEHLAFQNKIRIAFETTPTAVTKEGVTLCGPKGSQRIDADAVLILIGGSPAWELLSRIGIRRSP
jgi:thioredoxin reductase